MLFYTESIIFIPSDRTLQKAIEDRQFNFYVATLLINMVGFRMLRLVNHHSRVVSLEYRNNDFHKSSICSFID